MSSKSSGVCHSRSHEGHGRVRSPHWPHFPGQSLAASLPFASCLSFSPVNFGACVALTWGYAHHGRSARAGSSILLPRALLPALDHTLPRCVSIKIEFHYHSFQAGVRGTSHLWGVWPPCIGAVSHSRRKSTSSQSPPICTEQISRRETCAPALFRKHSRRHLSCPRR